MTTNVDDLELEKFSNLADLWWQPRGPMRPLHEINPVRVAWVNGLMPLQGKRVLDVGCGGGLLSEAMAKMGGQATGIDMSSKALQVARSHATTSALQVHYLETTAEALVKSGPAHFDGVTCMEVLEHVPDPAQTVAACAQLTRPGGWCFFSTLNRNAKSFALAIVGAEYILKLLPKGTHEYDKFIRPSELVRHTRAVGLDLVELCGIRYNPLTKRATLCADTDVNYLLACRRVA